MKSLCISIILSTSVFFSVYACSCAYIPTFCETITYNNDGHIHGNYLIVHASVEDKFATGMRIKVIDVLFGQSVASELTLESGNGADCRKNTSQFTVGDQHIFALYGSSPDGFSLSECGVTVLTVEGDKIKGSVAQGITSLTIEDFIQLGDCGNLSPTLTTISVRPTLTSDEIRILTTSDLQYVNIDIFDMQGRLLFSQPVEILAAGNPYTIPVDHFSSGCYTVVVEATALRKLFRIIIAS